MQIFILRKRLYGIGREAWAALLDSQGNRCAVCMVADPGPKGWATDHDHATGAVRGILCGRCNTAIGLLRDDAGIVSAAAEYLRRSRRDVTACAAPESVVPMAQDAAS